MGCLKPTGMDLVTATGQRSGRWESLRYGFGSVSRPCRQRSLSLYKSNRAADMRLQGLAPLNAKNFRCGFLWCFGSFSILQIDSGVTWKLSMAFPPTRKGCFITDL